jgi:hypothetical protein
MKLSFDETAAAYTYSIKKIAFQNVITAKPSLFCHHLRKENVTDEISLPHYSVHDIVT